MSASASSPRPISPCRKYDVFLSFYGKDTRKGFVSLLFAALSRNQIDTFIDYNLERGEAIEPALLEKIEQSHVSVVVFSANYAASEWCLQELAKIHRCMETMGHMAIPVFYRLDPSIVQELTASYGQALAGHGEKFDGQLVADWRRALQYISCLSGRVSLDAENEASLIDDIVRDVSKKLELLPFDDVNDDGFVGLDSCISEVELLLWRNDVKSVGIWGMGGIGKTALVEKLFNKISSKFEDSRFINVGDELGNSSLVGLRNRILSMLLKVEDHTIGTPSVLSMPTRRKLQKKKVLIVLDDVNSHQQIETLARHHQLNGPGTKMLITSRDRQVLKKGCDEMYEVKRLSYRHASQLFKKHAFLESHCTDRFMDLSKRLVRYADGIPKALEVLASKLHNKGSKQWENMLSKLANFPDKEISEVLKKSYDQLEDHENSIFLDIACFFVGEDLDCIKRFIDASGCDATSALKSLEDKSLIKIWRKRVVMHNLVQEMGLDIIRQQSLQEPGQRSRLRDPKDICRIIQKQRVRKKIEGMVLDLSQIQDVHASSTFFSQMHNFRLLRFYNSYPGRQKVFLPDGLEFLPDGLRSLVWYQYPLKSLPSAFNPANLVELRMPHSQVEQLLDSDQYLRNLKVIDLSDSKELIRIPNLSKVPDLEVLILKGCIKLVTMPLSVSQRKLTYLSLQGCISLKELPSSIECLRNLSYLSLEDCKNLCTFPRFGKLTNLKFLSLHQCSQLTQFPDLPLNLNVLNLGGTEITGVPPSIGQLSRLYKLDLSYCTKLQSLPDSIGDLVLLQQLSIEGCSKLANFPDCFCNLKSLGSLKVTFQDPDQFPEKLGDVETLKHLWLADCSITKIPFSASHLSKLESLGFWRCKSLVLTPLRGFNNLKVLQVKFCGISEVPDDLGSLTSLEELQLSEENLMSIPSGIKELSRLSALSVRGCKNLESLPEMPPAIQMLDTFNCMKLRCAPSSVAEYRAEHGIGHRYFMFGNCFGLNEDEHRKIIDGVHLSTQSLTSWLFSEVSLFPSRLVSCIINPLDVG
ncbi:hypothetical protein K2173_024565 [Erythroxylum novogranatense]|uniref:TIR domain-containing protein n=1 Tax=Erythroxylum novogranatense TaxID=1862640 RepID=A0AAV8SVG9_9ROSI|nr:hypothetical protein K2173_024565 [Erythroxylum novogranatense]